MGLFGLLIDGKKKRAFPKISHLYSTIMILDAVIPYLKWIKNR